MDNVYNWQFNCLPGSANQGAILMTRNDILRPPFTQDDFVWLAMEDVIGTADIRLTYNEKTNIYTLEKAIGHRNNDGSWIKDWYVVGSWERLSQEVADILRQLVYVEYRYDTTEPNTLKVIGIRKDMTQDIICNINFVSAEVLAEAVTTLDNKITAETTRATNKEDEIAEDLSDEVTRATQRENELQEMIESATMNPGRAIEVTAEKVINVLIDNESIKTNNSNQLKADVFDDTAIVNNKGWSSAKISQELTGAMHYKGQVATYADLPTTGLSEGDLYNVVDTGDNYAWNGSTWDKMSGEYIEGVGIKINGKVISATGIAFLTGNGLQVTGTGDNATLEIKGGNGLEFLQDKTVRVKGANGINIDSNGVNVDTGISTQIQNDKLEVKPSDLSAINVVTTGAHSGLDLRLGHGLTEGRGSIGDKKLDINANFLNEATALGNIQSGLILHSDGKIEVDKSGAWIPCYTIKKSQYQSLINFRTDITTNNNDPNFSVLNLSISNFTVIKDVIQYEDYDWIAVCSVNGLANSGLYSSSDTTNRCYYVGSRVNAVDMRVSLTGLGSSTKINGLCWNGIVPISSNDINNIPLKFSVYVTGFSSNHVTFTWLEENKLSGFPDNITIYALKKSINN